MGAGPVAFAEHLPALVVVAPLLAAPLCMLLPTAAPWLTAGVAWAVLAMAGMLAARVLAEGTLTYAMGGWAPPWGIAYRLDATAALVLLAVAGSGAAVALFAVRGVDHELAPGRTAAFYALFCLALAGMLGMVSTADAFNLFVFLEVASLASYSLVGLGPDRRALTAAFQYLIMGSIGATFILIGVGLLYMMTGTLAMQDLAARLPAVAHSHTVHTAFAFLTVGVGLKLALFPLHLWLPNAYTYAPSAVGALLAATATKVGVYMLVRLVFDVFGPAPLMPELPLGRLLMLLGLAAVISGSLVAVSQDNVKRMLGYSSIAQIGYMVLGVGLASASGLTAGLLHLFNHALIKGGLFLALGCLAYRVEIPRLGLLRGMGRRMPWTAAAFAVGALSLVGMPLTSGFLSKWYLVQAALEQDLWPVVAVVLLASLLSVVYLGRVLEALYFRDPGPGQAQVREAPLALLLPTWLLLGANLYLGVHSELSVGLARRAAATLGAG